MACVGLVPVTLECPVCSFPVEVSMCFWADFLLSIILRWLSPPPRVWSLATSFSCSASPNLACLEPGVSPGVCVCVCVCACSPMCMQAWSLTQDPPCLAAESGTRIVPLLGPARPLSDCPYLLCFWAAFPPPQMWACRLRPASLMEENTGLGEMFYSLLPLPVSVSIC